MLITSIKEKYNTEIALIILCCRHFIQTADNSAIRIFLQENIIDWTQLYQLSAAQRIRPVIYKTLIGFKEVIDEVNLTEFRNYCMYLNAFALNNKRELYRIVELLRQNNITVKPYKGIEFSENFYGDIGLREFSDNDLIIITSDIVGVVNIMNKDGFSSKDLKYYSKFPRQYIRDYKDLLFEKSNGLDREFAFEFHYKTSRYFQGYPFSFEEILGKDYLTEAIKYDENDHLKLMTISNGLNDFYPDIRSILDLTVILKKNQDIIFNNIDPILRSYLNYGLTISFSLLNYQIVSAEEAPDNRVVIFCEKLVEKILGSNPGRISVSKSTYFKIKNTHSLTWKLQHIKNYFLLIVRPNYNDINTLTLPYYSLYYFTKPFRLLIKMIRKSL